jgi:hypothetical protein
MTFGEVFLLACRQRYLKPDDSQRQAAVSALNDWREQGDEQRGQVDLAEAIVAAGPLLGVLSVFLLIALAGRILG